VLLFFIFGISNFSIFITENHPVLKKKIDKGKNMSRQEKLASWQQLKADAESAVRTKPTPIQAKTEETVVPPTGADPEPTVEVTSDPVPDVPNRFAKKAKKTEEPE
jgi:hypothetical protein